MAVARSRQRARATAMTADRNGGPLHRPQGLLENEHPKQHRDERIDEVAEGCLDHVAIGHAVDEAAPVQQDDDREKDQDDHHPAVLGDAAERLPTTGDRDEHQHEQRRRPDDPVGEDLERTGRIEQRPVQQEGLPAEIRRRAPSNMPLRESFTHRSVRRCECVVWEPFEVVRISARSGRSAGC